MRVGHCDAINPDTGDRCQEARGHPGGHYVQRVDRWESPYRMAEPENVGAAVIDAGLFVWRLSSEARWRADEGMAWCQWADITDPEPFQNCVLTANDPEPPNGSIVMDGRGDVWRHSGGYWVSNVYFDCWQNMGDFGPFTLLYRGEA